MAAKSNVQAVAQRIVGILRDANADSWTLPMIHEALNESEKVVVIFRPDASATDHSFTCAAGFKQDISGITNPVPHRLLGVKFNGSYEAPGRGVRERSVEDMDAINPSWRAATPASTIREFVFDEREPMLFYTSPPATAEASLQIVYSAIPAAYGSVSGSTVTTVSAIYEPMIIDWSLYRLFGHDTENSVNVARSQQHLQNFQNAMGIKIKGEALKSLNNPEFRK